MSAESERKAVEAREFVDESAYEAYMTDNTDRDAALLVAAALEQAAEIIAPALSHSHKEGSVVWCLNCKQAAAIRALIHAGAQAALDEVKRKARLEELIWASGASLNDKDAEAFRRRIAELEGK